MVVKRVLTAQEVIQLDALADHVPALSQAHTKSPRGKLELGQVLKQLQGKLALHAVLTVGAEADVAANAIEIAGVVTDLDGHPVAAATSVLIEAFAKTANEGDLAAAGTPVGTVLEALTPATGMNLLYMETTTAGLFSFRVTDTTASEKVFVRVTVAGGEPQSFELNFA